MGGKKIKSKRIPLRKKYKLKKKIAEHNRKLRKAAKKNTSFVQKKINKANETRLPNSYPFKGEILKNLQLKKEQRVEEKTDQQKDARQQEQDKRRKSSGNSDLHTYAAESAAKDLEFTRKETMAELVSYTREAKDNSMQAYYHEFKKVVESADVIIEVLDARDPMGCRCPDVETTIATKYPSKKIILLLNKIDLVPKQNVEKWMAYLRNSYPTVAFKSSTQKKGKISHKESRFAKASSSDLMGSESLGGDALLQLLKHYARTGTVRTSITVGLIGFPNVGKSSVINSLCRVRAASVGATPGVTKTSQEIHLDKRVKLLDTPGIVFPKAGDVSDDIVLRNVVKIEQVRDPISPVSSILKRCNKHVILSIYKIPDFNTTDEFLIQIAKKRGKILQGGVPNVHQAARMVLQDWTGGKIPFYTEPPAVAPDVHVGATIVSEFAPDFDISQAQVLAALQDNDIIELHGTQLSSSNPLAAQDVFMEGDDNDSDKEDEEGEEEVDDNSASAMIDEDDDELPIAHAIQQKQTQGKPTTNKQTTTISRKQDLSDEADQFNPQINKNKKKQLQKDKKKAKKGTYTPSRASSVTSGADYDFSEHYGEPEDENDIDVDDIED